MSQLLCSQQHPEQQNQRQNSRSEPGKDRLGEPDHAGLLSMFPSDSAAGNPALQCASSGRLPDPQTAALFGHYADGNAERASSPAAANSQAQSQQDTQQGERSGNQPAINPSQAREGARIIRAAFGRFSSDHDAVLRVLNQHPELVRAVREVYDAEFSVTGKGLIGDIKEQLGDPYTEVVSALLTRAGVGVGQTPLTFVRQTAKGQHQNRHTIIANPAVQVAVPGTQIGYSVAMGAELYAEGSYYTYQWLCLNDPLTSKAKGMPEIVWGSLNTMTWNAGWNFPGNHKIICRVQFREKNSGLLSGHTDHAPEYIEYQQTVHEQGDVLAREIDKAPSRESPADQLRFLHAYQQTLVTAEHQPGSGKLDSKAEEALATQITKLSEKLKSSEGHTRYPLKAVHVAAEKAQVSPLNVFVSRTSASYGQETWTLVDITNPADRRLTGEYVGTGQDAQRAIQSAIAAWDSSNRYPKGRLRVQVPAETGTNLDREFQTDGLSFWDSIAEFFTQVGFWAGLGMLGAAVVATVAPDPTVSKVAAALLWTAILAGTAGASVNMIQRHAEGMSTLSEDAFDTITIVGNILGARWALGATVKGLSLAGSRMGTAIVIGRCGTDAAQGILLSVEYVKEYQQILTERDPKHRTDKLLQLLGKAAVSGGLLVLSMRGSREDLAKLDAQKADIKRLGSQGETINLVKAAADSGAPSRQPTGRHGSSAASSGPQVDANGTQSHVETQINQQSAIATGQHKGRVTEAVPGLYQSVDTHLDQAPPGWTFRDTNDLQNDGRMRLITECRDPNGKEGRLIRFYDPKTQTYMMDSAFFADDMQRWIDAGTSMVAGKGTPLVTYLMLRQLRMAGVCFGGLRTVKMSTIQNVEAVLHLTQLQRQGTELAAAVRQTHSVQYAETTIVQSGHQIVAVRVDDTHAWHDPIDKMLQHHERSGECAIIQKHEALLAKYNLKRTDEMMWNYDIYLDLAPHVVKKP